MRDLGFSWMAISQMLSVNVRTLYNHRIQLGLVDYGNFNNISNVDLDHLITEILTHTPGSGESYISGSLRGRGIRVQRWRVRERLRIVDPVGRALRGRRAIQRRVYNVTVPNQVWYAFFHVLNLINVNYYFLHCSNIIFCLCFNKQCCIMSGFKILFISRNRLHDRSTMSKS